LIDFGIKRDEKSLSRESGRLVSFEYLKFGLEIQDFGSGFSEISL